MAQGLTAKKPMDPVTVKVSHTAEARSASKAARSLAENLGFPSTACDEIALVASELAMNLVKHGGGGELVVIPLDSTGKTGIEIVAEDKGPGIADFELALTDGYSTAGSLGVGLGAVNRLMDALQFSSGPKGGLRVVCQRWMRPQTRNVCSPGLAFGIATRP